ncbi:MAG: cysteine--tRNA ligase [Clostridia bacterium]|nr:cysteine--tRNA ligase [Clostridia bacterium]
MALKIYNSFTKTRQEFKPIIPGFVGMYVCGPTVYGPPHLGHARSYTNFDVVFRYLQYLGYKVKYVQNITDVGHLVGDGDDGEDKILKQAKKENVDPYEIAYKYETLYFDAMQKLNILKPSISARATGFIPEMIDMVEKLIAKGYAYVTPKGNVYYRVHKFGSYGQLSNRKLENTLSGERIDIATDKENPEDFALWKTAEGGHIMKWKSPWGEGYPGWHIECSTLSKKFLGETFDIHGGGIDNIFPHHECECAQSEIANGKKFVNFFMHNNLVTVNGTKMGKSLGNFITLEDLFSEFDSMYVRYFILQFHYRSPVDFTKQAIAKAGEQFDKIRETYKEIKALAGDKVAQPKDASVLEIFNNFIAAMDEDFNTPLAISELLKLTKLAGQVVQNKDAKTASELIDVFGKISFILGLDFEGNEEKKEKSGNEEKLLEIIADVRNKLRAEKNYAASDYIRDQLSAAGIVVSDKKV